jgi:hypothetical protein
MTRAAFLFLSLGVAGCNQPSPALWGAKATQVQVAGYAMTLWQLDDQVEIIRHGYAPRADQRHLRAAMAQAMVDATGCALRTGTLEGDTGVLRAALDCS